jgi:hypothetical protein
MVLNIASAALDTGALDADTCGEPQPADGRVLLASDHLRDLLLRWPHYDLAAPI